MLAAKAFDIARRANLWTVSLVSVQQSDTFWQRVGFSVVAPLAPDLYAQLQHYGPDAKFMICSLSDKF